ncbi:MAG: acyl-CoA thioesterase [Candidatus Moduliflexus flocculans]|nr:acyl-CoA thioesterase [Candidatus Moduliflexus flocculans]
MNLTDYPLRSYDKVRYADTDRQGHVNNAVFSQCFETGIASNCSMIPSFRCHDPGCSFVIASAKVEYRKEIIWPGTVEIGTAVVRIGTSSITMAQGLFQNGFQLVATGETVIVHVDPASSRSRPLKYNHSGSPRTMRRHIAISIGFYKIIILRPIMSADIESFEVAFMPLLEEHRRVTRIARDDRLIA